MADKKSFIMYDNWSRLLCGMPDEQAGKLIKAICSYKIGEYEATNDPVIDAVFNMIREKLDEDSAHYESVCQKRAEARQGKTKENKTIYNNSKQLITIDNKTQQYGGDTDNDTDTDILSKDNINISARQKRKEEKQASKHKHGVNQNVLLTDDELAKLKDAYPDYEERIDSLSYYMKSTGKKYADHYMTILSWARREDKGAGKAKPRKNTFNDFSQTNNYDFEELEKTLIQN